MLYGISGGTVAYADKVIIKDINFEIRNTEKIAVVGRNGCGKTTFLKLILGELPLDKKDTETGFIAPGNPVIGCLKQMTFEDNEELLSVEIKKVFKPLLEMKEKMNELLTYIEANPDSAETQTKANEYALLEERFTYQGGYRMDRDYDLIISRFGFSEADQQKKLSEFSGGQRTKIAFIKLLLSKPDILLLDEPTNHLDISTIGWLEGYLKEYPRAVVVVSHDRMFLDRVADVVYEIEHQKLKRYPGNYSDFIKRKKEDYEKQKKDYEAQQKEIERLETIVERFKNKPTKVAMTRSKLKAIEHMDKIDRPENADIRAFQTELLPARESGNDVLFIENLAIGYDSVLTKLSLDMKKNQKIAVIGGNGLGKSTFLKTIMEMLPKKGGKYSFGHNVDIGYFDQQMAQYVSDKQVIDDLWDEFPTLTETEVRNILGGFLFRGEDVFKKVSMLSGGEKVRLALAKIFQRKPNFLILDEPTNHMDIVGKEALEEMLISYKGSILFVSHDRYFVNRIADSLLIFEGGKAVYYPYRFQEYEEKYGSLTKETGLGNNALNINAGTNNGSQATDASTGKKPDSQKNYSNPGKEKAKREARIKKLESLIEQSEDKIAQLKEEMSNPELASDYIKLAELSKNVEELEGKIEEYMDEWGILSEEE